MTPGVWRTIGPTILTHEFDSQEWPTILIHENHPWVWHTRMTYEAYVTQAI